MTDGDRWGAACHRAQRHRHELIDRNAVLRIMEEHRTGTLDHSRRIWALQVFMLWHGIFVERTVVPRIPEPHYPIRL